MDKSKRITIICVVIAALIIGFICYTKITERIIVESGSDVIPDGYICVFNGGAGEITYSTYIYKDKNSSANYGFTYINTTNTTKSWGSSDWNVKITDKGSIGWTDEVFDVARENNAYSYVISNGQKYSIDEFMNRFLMDK